MSPIKEGKDASARASRVTPPPAAHGGARVGPRQSMGDSHTHRPVCNPGVSPARPPALSHQGSLLAQDKRTKGAQTPADCSLLLPRMRPVQIVAANRDRSVAWWRGDSVARRAASPSTRQHGHWAAKPVAWAMRRRSVLVSAGNANPSRRPCASWWSSISPG